MSVLSKASFYAATEAKLQSMRPLPFPPFRSPGNRDCIFYLCYHFRTELENLGDQSMYCVVGYTLRMLCPGRSRSFYHDVTQVITSNWFFGWYLRLLDMFHGDVTSGSKDGGDSFETLIGALVRDTDLMYLQRWSDVALAPYILACGSLVEDITETLPSQPSSLLPAKNLTALAIGSAGTPLLPMIPRTARSLPAKVQLDAYVKGVLGRIGFATDGPAPTLVIPAREPSRWDPSMRPALVALNTSSDIKPTSRSRTSTNGGDDKENDFPEEQAEIAAVIIAEVAKLPAILAPFPLDDWHEKCARRGRTKDELDDCVDQGRVRFKTAVKVVIGEVVGEGVIISGHALAASCFHLSRKNLALTLPQIIGDAFINDTVASILVTKMNGRRLPMLTLPETFYTIIFDYSFVDRMCTILDVTKWVKGTLSTPLQAAQATAARLMAKTPRATPSALPRK
ncbi:hypothetical protein B0H11DRAFT_2345250 [Mycena galericulata]|nr:hypothetical protein B0H11DRAFT_2345250 [Mycena galericulata]